MNDGFFCYNNLFEVPKQQPSNHLPLGPHGVLWVGVSVCKLQHSEDFGGRY